MSATPGKNNLKTIVRIVLISVAVVLLIAKVFFIGIYVIPQNGMYPGLPAGSRLYASRHPYAGPASVKRGDIVIFKRDEDGQPYVYIWRVVGLPGDAVVAAGESLTINGQLLPRQRVREADGKTIYREQNGTASYEVAILPTANSNPVPDMTTNVPAGQFFVMGDNRMDAIDSRTFGPIPFSAIIGKKY